MKTTLKLSQVYSSDETIALLVDSSVYNPDLPVENSYLEVTVPGFTSFVQVIYQPGTVIALTTKNLGLSDKLDKLPSGVYKVVQTIKPNDQLRQEYHFLQHSVERNCLSLRICDALTYNLPVESLLRLHVELLVSADLVSTGLIEAGSKIFNAIEKRIHVQL